MEIGYARVSINNSDKELIIVKLTSKNMKHTLSSIECGVILSVILGVCYLISTGISAYFLATDNPAVKSTLIALGFFLCLSFIPAMVGVKLAGMKMNEILPQFKEGLHIFPLLSIILVSGIRFVNLRNIVLIILAGIYFILILRPLLNYLID